MIRLGIDVVQDFVRLIVGLVVIFLFGLAMAIAAVSVGKVLRLDELVVGWLDGFLSAAVLVYVIMNETRTRRS
jgi:hypothetical protein